MTYKASADDLFSAAAKRFSCSDAVAFSELCSEMIEHFGDDEQIPEWSEAFAYARSKYGYLSPDELEAVQGDDADNDICRHGLDWMTCPAGCFED